MPLPFSATHNTITHAVQFFKEAAAIRNFSLKIELQKKIPIGGGFGGGSSDGVTILKLLNQIFGEPLNHEQLTVLAQKLGVDCPFFIENTAQYATGRGDLLFPVSETFKKQMKQYRCFLFCPHFSISTVAAYTAFKKHPRFVPKVYNAKVLSEGHAYFLQNLSTQTLEGLLFNSFEAQMLAQYPQLQRLFLALRKSGYSPHLTGSGSGCFCLSPELVTGNAEGHNYTSPFNGARNLVYRYLGPNAFCQEVSFLS